MPLRFFCAAAFLAASLKAAPSSKSTVRLVEYFIDTDTSELPPGVISDFMAVDPAELPEKLRVPYLAKKEELLALLKISKGKKKPPLRRLGLEPPECEEPKLGSVPTEYILRLARYEPITEDEEQYLMDKANCSECELRTEFSLQIVLQPPKKKGERPKRLYFLHPKDPIMTLVGAYRQGDTHVGTSFFGISPFPKCR